MVEKEAAEDLYSVEELEKDLKKVKGGRRLVWLLVGLALGVAGTLLLPPLLRPYLPEAIRGGGVLLTGLILEEEREGDRLLLTVDADRGALIASFTRRVSEIGLLVERGDSVTLAVPDYEPFLEDPDIEGIRKARPGSRRPSAATDSADPSGRGEGPPADSAPPDTAGTPADTAGARGDTSGQRGVPADSVTGRRDAGGDDSTLRAQRLS